jgi:hypothetical protein
MEEKVNAECEILKKAIRRLRPFVRCLPGAAPRSKVLQPLSGQASWLMDVNFVGFAMGEKWTAGKRVKGKPCLKIYVHRKVAKAKLLKNLRIPVQFYCDLWGERILTDVEEWRGFPVAQAKTIQPGMKIGIPLATGGTLGLIVKRRASGDSAALSCAHVLAPHGAADKGKAAEQPSAEFGSIPANRFGQVLDFTEIRSTGVNSADAAITSVNTGVTADPSIPDIGMPSGILDIRPEHFLDASRLVVVKPKSAFSGQTEGRIEAHNGSIRVRFENMGITASFDNVVVYGALTTAGDSGSAVLAKGTRLVAGLHMAGHSASGKALFMPIRAVLDRFQVDLVTSP